MTIPLQFASGAIIGFVNLLIIVRQNVSRNKYLRKKMTTMTMTKEKKRNKEEKEQEKEEEKKEKEGRKEERRRGRQRIEAE